MTDLARFQHPRFARMYEQISAESELRGTAEHRDRVLTGLTGRVIEIGAGNGLNFGRYPDTVAEVVAVEPDDTMRTMGEAAADRASVPAADSPRNSAQDAPEPCVGRGLQRRRDTDRRGSLRALAGAGAASRARRAVHVGFHADRYRQRADAQTAELPEHGRRYATRTRARRPAEPRMMQRAPDIGSAAALAAPGLKAPPLVDPTERSAYDRCSAVMRRLRVPIRSTRGRP
jgi:hypothetical protein